MWFDFGRSEGFPTQYAANQTPVTVDVLEAGLILSFVILAVCFYIILIGLRGKQATALFIRITISLTLGAIVIVGNFGQEWEIGHINTNTSYRAGSGQEIEANIGVKIGLRSVNVTLKTISPPENVLKGEKIDYNERFEWTWDQGRFGFGPYAGHLQRSFREAQYRGLPLPILWVVDYFVFDGEGLRFGRFYRTAGWYAHICMWISFVTWILSNILFLSVIRFGINFLALTGILQLTACLVWLVVRNVYELDIPFQKESITMKFGSSFYLTLIGGIVSCVLALTIFLCNIFWEEETAQFFNVDPLSDYDEFHLTREEVKLLRDKSGENKNDIPMNDMYEDEQTYDDVVILKRRSTIRFGKKRNTIKNLPINEEEQPIYSNLDTVNENIPLHTAMSHVAGHHIENENLNHPSTSRQLAPKIPPRGKNM